MNSLISSPAVALAIADRMIDEQVRDARARARGRAARAARTRRLSAAPREPRLPWWVFRYVHPA